MAEKRMSREEALANATDVADDVVSVLETAEFGEVDIHSIRKQQTSDRVDVTGEFKSFTHMDQRANPAPPERVINTVRDVHDAVIADIGMDGIDSPLRVIVKIHSAYWVWGDE
jgi:hypothetical protein